MGSTKIIEACMVGFCLAAYLLTTMGGGVHGADFDVKKHGAKGDGKADDSKAFTAAWDAACRAPAQNTVTFPAGTYAAGPVAFRGPCKGPIAVKATGATVVALEDPALFKNTWVLFSNVDRLTLTGGIFDGKGALAWKNNCAKAVKVCQLPVSLYFNTVTNSKISGVTSRNSKYFHMNIVGCKGVTLEKLTIDAPGNSPNTDGIHVGLSAGINITDANIKTGDDCVSIGDGCDKINVEKVTCGPGHGISIGSLGKYPNEKPVSGITVRNCTLTGTMNGVRVKTWPASPASTATSLHFHDIIMNNVGSPIGNPINIDQKYCPYNQCKAEVPSRIKIVDVAFRNIKGTSTNKVAVKLVCSKEIPCQQVQLADINLVYTGKDGPATSECANVKPLLSGKLLPQPCTAAPHP
ncbi:hypothetical protein DM860_002890 [Cuscuta australis]|uniref:Pectate lyase superfamily protein domain-containing protein n=1 Tax=Cuscuta australis TaxID=267555 RepID=A0A328D0T9_9ASTE|nr:hypothetical protein DM860_002890 [Cuscuta australis]